MVAGAPRYVGLNDISRMTGMAPGMLLAVLPPPTLIVHEGETISVWSTSDVDAFQRRATTHDIERLTRRRSQLRKDVDDLEQTARDLRTEIKKAKTELRNFHLVPDAVEASTKQGTDAFWRWEPPQPPPKRLQGVYRLMRQGRTFYIGQSVNIMSRVADHTEKKDFDQFSYALVDGDKKVLNEVESALIITERPPGNHSYQGVLMHPTGHGWAREEAQAILDKYGVATAVAEKEAVA